jgi:flagellar motor switch protein FliG
MPYVPIEQVNDVLNDFYELCLTQKVITEGGVDYARSVLEKAFGADVAAKLMEKVSRSMQAKAFEFVRKSDYKNLLAIMQNEYPQTIALILSYINSDQAAMVLSELPKEKRVEVVERIATMESASPETIAAIEATLERKFAAVVSMDLTEVGGVNYVADILNHVDRSTEKYIFDELSIRDPALVEESRRKCSYSKILLDSILCQYSVLSEMSKQRILPLQSRAQTARLLLYYMQICLRECRKPIQQEIEYLHNVRMRDVEEAQQRIVGIIRHLEDEGELVIGKGGEDEIIA